MTERKPSMTRTCGGPGSIEYHTQLPVVIQIKLKTDHKRRNRILCKEKCEHQLRSDDSRCSKRIQSRSFAMDSRTNSSFSQRGKIMKNQMKHQRIHRETTTSQSDASHSDKWRIFDRKPYKSQHLTDWDKKNSTGFSSSDGSVCRCDEIPRFHFVDQSKTRRTPGLASKIDRHQPPEVDEKSSNNENHQSNGHSQSDKTFSIHSNSSTNRLENKHIINTLNKPVVKTTAINRPRKSHENKEKYTLQNRTKIDSNINADQTKIPLHERPIIAENIKRDKAGLSELNYRLIINVLNGSSATDKICILEGIRWRLTKSTAIEREKTLRDIRQNDLFGIQSSNGGKTRLEHLLWPAYHPCHQLQKSTAKLLYTIVSMKTGRDYVRNISIVQSLAWRNALCGQSQYFTERPLVDLETAEYFVSIMMKLSSMEFHRDDMINHDIINWIVSHVTDVEYSGSPYHFKCITKLIIELISGRKNCDFLHKDSSQLLILLVRLLENKKLETCRLYMLKTILMLLKQANVIQNARELNLEQVLWKRYQETQNVTERKLMEYILLVLSEKMVKSKSEGMPGLLNEQKFVDADLDLDTIRDQTAVSSEDVFDSKYSTKYRSSRNLFKNIKDINKKLPLDRQLEYAETTMEIHSVPSRNHIFAKESKNEAKFENYRHFHRQFLSLPLDANLEKSRELEKLDKSNKPIVSTLPDNVSLAKARTSPEIQRVRRQSKDRNSDEERDTFEDAKAILYVFDETIRPAARTTDNESLQQQLAGIRKRQEFINSNAKSGSLDSDVVVGIFEGKDTSDEDEKPKIKLHHVDLSVPKNSIPFTVPVENIAVKSAENKRAQVTDETESEAKIEPNNSMDSTLIVNSETVVSNTTSQLPNIQRVTAQIHTTPNIMKRPPSKGLSMSEPENKTTEKFTLVPKKCVSVPSIPIPLNASIQLPKFERNGSPPNSLNPSSTIIRITPPSSEDNGVTNATIETITAPPADISPIEIVNTNDDIPQKSILNVMDDAKE